MQPRDFCNIANFKTAQTKLLLNLPFWISAGLAAVISVFYTNIFKVCEEWALAHATDPILLITAPLALMGSFFDWSYFFKRSHWQWHSTSHRCGRVEQYRSSLLGKTFKHSYVDRKNCRLLPVCFRWWRLWKRRPDFASVDSGVLSTLALLAEISSTSSIAGHDFWLEELPDWPPPSILRWEELFLQLKSWQKHMSALFAQLFFKRSSSQVFWLSYFWEIICIWVTPPSENFLSRPFIRLFLSRSLWERSPACLPKDFTE